MLEDGESRAIDVHPEDCAAVFASARAGRPVKSRAGQQQAALRKRPIEQISKLLEYREARAVRSHLEHRTAHEAAARACRAVKRAIGSLHQRRTHHSAHLVTQDAEAFELDEGLGVSS